MYVHIFTQQKIETASQKSEEGKYLFILYNENILIKCINMLHDFSQTEKEKIAKIIKVRPYSQIHRIVLPPRIRGESSPDAILKEYVQNMSSPISR